MPSIRSVRKKVRPFSIEEVCRLLDLAREPTIRQKFRNADRKPNNRVILDALRDGGKTAGEIKAIFAADSRKPKSVSPLLVAMKNNGEIIQRDGAYHLGNVTLLSKGQPQEPEVDLIASALLGTGVRRGELCGFADDNIDLDAGIVETTRNVVLIRNKVVVQDIPEDDGSRRKIALPPYVVERLREQRKRLLERAMAWGPDYQRKPLYYFPAPGGGPCDPSQVTERMDRLIARAGIAKIDERGRKVSPVHSWRHTSGSSLWSAYKDVKQVQARLGHATSEITMDTYVHADEAVDRTAAAHFEKLLRR